MTVTAFGQGDLNKDLKKSLKRYDLIKLDKRAVFEKAKTEQPIELQAYGRAFEFVLTPNDLRSDYYEAVETNASGDVQLPFNETVTYKGKLSDDLDSEVRFTVTEKGFKGFIYTGDEKFFITPAEDFSKYAQKGDTLVYTENDLLKTVDLSNDIHGELERWENKMGFESFSAAAAELRELEVATEADYQWVTQAGGSAATANSEILGLLNMVDGIYRRDLNLTIKVTFQHAWTTSDPIAGGGMSTTLDSFLNYWNANYPVSQRPRDTAHLFTGKYSNQGLAYIGTVCRSPNYSYGLSGRSGSVTHLIAAHEIGHNLNAQHADNSGSCANSLMNPTISFNATSFCDLSKSAISSFISGNGGCLSVVGSTGTPTPTPYVPTPTPYVPTPTPFVPTPTPFVPTPTPYVAPTPVPTPNVRTNVALASNGGVASASSQISGGEPSRAIDGVRNWATTGTWKDSTADSYPDVLQVDFNGNKTINEIAVYAVRDDFGSNIDPSEYETFSAYGITNFEVQYWNGSYWLTVPNGSVSYNNRVVTRITFPAVTTNRIRVVVYNAQANYSRIVELEAWSGSGTTNPTPTPYVPTPTPYVPTPTPVTPTPTPNTGRTNVALASNGGLALSSSQSSGGEPSRANDGIRNWATTGAWKDATPNSYPDSLQVNFNGSKSINEVVVYAVKDDFGSTVDPSEYETFSAYGITDFEVQYWNGSSFTNVPGGSITNNNKVITRVTFPAITTTAVRILINNAQAGYSRIVELEAWSGNGTANPTPTPNTGRTNVALASNGSVASASSQISGGEPSRAIDGVRNWATTGTWKDSTADSYPDWLQVDFNGNKTINEIAVYAVRDDFGSNIDPSEYETFSAYGITNFEVQYWNGYGWATVQNGSIGNTNRTVTRITFSPITTSRIRVVVYSAQANYSRIVELEAWGN
ncbi:MAG TPA: discoidin domain-containing protein [Pyrinomonadaceae bacterium]